MQANTLQIASLGDVIPVQDTNDEYNYLASHHCDRDGSSMVILEQTTMEMDGRYYDRVTTRCPTDGEERTFIFDVSAMFGK